QTITVLFHVAGKAHGPKGVVFARVEGRQSLLDVKAELPRRAGIVRPEPVGTDDDVAIVRPVGGVDAAIKFLGTVQAGPGAHHGGPRVPRVVVSRAVNPRSDNHVPAVVGTRQVGLFQERVQGSYAIAYRRLPEIVRRIAVDQHLIRVDGDLR